MMAAALLAAASADVFVSSRLLSASIAVLSDSIAPSTRGSAGYDSVDIAEGTPSLRQVCETTGIYVYKSMYNCHLL